MTYPSLKPGSKGKDVSTLQTLLNKVGAMLSVDGDYGPGTTAAIRYAQEVAKQTITGLADVRLWDFLESQPHPFSKLDTNGVAFIALEETGGLAYYQKITRFPHWPGGLSGITIGVGYDLRYSTLAAFNNDWGALLSVRAMQELAKDIGKQGSKARADALKEMANIQQILAEAEQARAQGKPKAEVNRLLLPVADELLEMKKYWPVTSGLVKRRQLEANLWRQSLG